LTGATYSGGQASDGGISIAHLSGSGNKFTSKKVKSEYHVIKTRFNNISYIISCKI
jgi:hypothetical protein